VFLGEYEGRKVAVKAIMGEKVVLSGPAAEGGLEHLVPELHDIKMQERRERMAQLEAVLMAAIHHPNIVTTYKCLTSWSEGDDEAASPYHGSRPQLSLVQYEWFIIMELCTKGSLWEALLLGRYHFPVDESTGRRSYELRPHSQSYHFTSTTQAYGYSLSNSQPLIGPSGTQVLGRSGSGKSQSQGQLGQPQSMVLWDAWAALQVLREVVLALEYLHENGILHGDLKAANVLLAACDRDRRGYVAKVTDFGFGRIMSSNHIKTKTYGTVTHQPPELLAQGVLTASADVYAIGILMWEVYMAQGVFKELSDTEVVLQVAKAGLRPEFPRGTPARYAAFAARCWAEVPEVRPSIPEVAAELAAIQKELCPMGQHSPPVTVPGNAPRNRSRLSHHNPGDASPVGGGSTGARKHNIPSRVASACELRVPRSPKPVPKQDASSSTHRRPVAPSLSASNLLHKPHPPPSRPQRISSTTNPLYQDPTLGSPPTRYHPSRLARNHASPPSGSSPPGRIRSVSGPIPQHNLAGASSPQPQFAAFHSAVMNMDRSTPPSSSPQASSSGETTGPSSAPAMTGRNDSHVAALSQFLYQHGHGETPHPDGSSTDATVISFGEVLEQQTGGGRGQAPGSHTAAAAPIAAAASQTVSSAPLQTGASYADTTAPFGSTLSPPSTNYAPVIGKPGCKQDMQGLADDQILSLQPYPVTYSSNKLTMMDDPYGGIPAGHADISTDLSAGLVRVDEEGFDEVLDQYLSPTGADSLIRTTSTGTAVFSNDMALVTLCAGLANTNINSSQMSSTLFLH